MNFEDLSISKSQQSVEETLKTEIRRLEEEIKHKIAMKLEKRNNFEEFMLALPKSPDVFLSKKYESDDYPRKYNIEQVQAIQSASEFQKRRRLNGEILFDEWGTSGHQRPCVVHLIVALDKIKLYNASNILRTHIGMNEKYNNTVVHSLNIENESMSDGVELKVMKDLQNNLSDGEDNDDEDLVGPISTESLTDLNIKEFAYTDIKDKTNNFNSQSFIGSGGFGKVYLATNLVDNIPLVAVKVMTKIDAQKYKHYYRELKIISELEHENILKLLGYSFEREACVIYEYASGGSLSTLLEKTRKSAEKYEFKDRVKNLWEISKALLYLHNEKNLVHRDVKPENILLDGGVAKLCDFGLTKSLVEGLATETRIAGTNQYMAPELHRYEVTASADVYAFGLVLLITLTDLKVVDKQRGEDDLFLPNFIEKRITDTTKHHEFMQTFTGMPLKSEPRLKLIELALDCTRTDKTLRPPIKHMYENLLARLEG